MNYQKIDKTAWFKFEAESFSDTAQMHISDETVFQMVDDGIEEVGVIFRNGRLVASLDDWLDRKSDGSVRSMPITLMDRR